MYNKANAKETTSREEAMKKECKVIFECDEKEACLTFVSDNRILTLDLSGMGEVSIDQLYESFESCGKDVE